MRFSIKILVVIALFFLLAQSASATVNVSVNQNIVDDTGYTIHCEGWTCSQLTEIIPNGDTVIDYGHVVEANDAGYTALKDFLFTNINSKAKEVAPECYAQEGWTCSQLTEIIPNGDTVIDYGHVVEANDAGYTALKDFLFTNINSKAKEVAPECYPSPTPTPGQPEIGFTITGVQAVTAAAGAAAIGGLALYWIRYLR